MIRLIIIAALIGVCILALASLIGFLLFVYERANAPWTECRDDEYFEKRERERKEKGLRR